MYKPSKGTWIRSLTSQRVPSRPFIPTCNCKQYHHRATALLFVKEGRKAAEVANCGKNRAPFFARRFRNGPRRAGTKEGIFAREQNEISASRCDRIKTNIANYRRNAINIDRPSIIKNNLGHTHGLLIKTSVLASAGRTLLLAQKDARFEQQYWPGRNNVDN